MRPPLRRRRFLALPLAAAPAAAFAQNATRPTVKPKPQPLDLTQFEPKSMLHVRETRVERARFPLIDIHTHLTWGDPQGKTASLLMPVPELLAVMDRRNLRTLVNLTGGRGDGLKQAVELLHKPNPARFLVFTEPWFTRVSEPGYAKFQGDEIGRAHANGARGLKVLKSLGLVVRERETKALVKIDDSRFDPMWEACGANKMPVAIHTSDPEAFFLPIDRFNERFEELNAHPDWSFHGRDFPSDRELQEARLRVVARHPKTNFIALHVANAENLDYVSAALDKHHNLFVEIGARIGELGRQPRAARKFFEKHQDRILFGTDAVPHGIETPQQIFGDELYQIYFRFLETGDEYFDYAPAKVPPQGRWRIYGLGLPDSILKKVYWSNAARLLNIQ
ncbi:MAG TPA: amidohydrolase family protein [Bryobacteraceae bacterium]|nr:amidohydrolase family protein [Bryobacteraceae bacterium]